MRNNRLMLSSALIAMLAIAGCGQSSAPESATTNEGGATPAAAAAPAPRPQPITVPAGTSIEVTVDQAVSSKTSNSGDHFAASVAAPVIADGKTVIPKGANVSGLVAVAKSAGKFKGNAELSLTLSSVTISGTDYDLKTSSFTETTGSRGKRTAITTGVGAAAGAVVGAIVGGGKGAAIGAGVGAGGGAVGAAATGQRDVEVPAETRIGFKLSQPVTIEAGQS